MLIKLIILLLIIYILIQSFTKKKENFFNIMDLIYTEDELKNDYQQYLNNKIENKLISFDQNNKIIKKDNGYITIKILDYFPNSAIFDSVLINNNDTKYMYIKGELENKVKINNIEHILIGSLSNDIYNKYILNIKNKKIVLNINEKTLTFTFDKKSFNISYLNGEYILYDDYYTIGKIISIDEETYRLKINKTYKKYINFISISFILLVKKSIY